MRSRSFVTAAVVVALGTALISPSAWAGENAPVAAVTHVDFQKAIAHAVEQSASRQVDGYSRTAQISQRCSEATGAVAVT